MPMVYMVISFWIVGMTMGYNLTFSRGMGPAGMWVGMIAGLTVAAGLMLRRVKSHQQTPDPREISLSGSRSSRSLNLRSRSLMR